MGDGKVGQWGDCYQLNSSTPAQFLSKKDLFSDWSGAAFLGGKRDVVVLLQGPGMDNM